MAAPTPHRVVWTDADGVSRQTRPIPMSLAFEALGQLMACELTGTVQQRLRDGRWTSLGVAQPAARRPVRK